MKTFAQSVASYLDQYKAEQKPGRFITVDPNDDGDTHVVFVSDDGKINPKSENPGEWKGYDDDQPISQGDAPQIAYKKKDIGINPYETVPARRNKDGSKRKNSKADTRLAFGIKGVQSYDREKGKFVKRDKRGNLPRERRVRSFEETARDVGFPADVEPTAQDIAELRSIAKEIQEDVNYERQQIVQIMREMFGGGKQLNAWQIRARHAEDIAELEPFGIDEKIAGQTYSDAESNHLGLLAAHAGLKEGADAEDIVFAALRKPLPKPLALASEQIVELAGERLENMKYQDDQPREEYEDDGRGIFGDYDDPEDLTREDEPEYDDVAVPFSAMSFRDAVEQYASKYNRDKQGRFISVGPEGDKHAIFVTNDGVVNPNSKNPGKWKDYKAKETPQNDWKSVQQITPGMQAAREKLVAKENTRAFGKMSKKQRRSLEGTFEKFGGREKLREAKAHELTQDAYLAKRLLEVRELQEKLLNDKGPLGEWLRNRNTDGPMQRSEVQELNELDIPKSLMKEINKIRPRDKREKDPTDQNFTYAGARSLLEFTYRDKGETARNIEYGDALDAVMGFARYEEMDRALTKHRNEVRKAIKRGEEVPEDIYGVYSDAKWQPADAKVTKRASIKYAQDVKRQRELDSFRVKASIGRKVKAQANAAVDGWRKQVLSARNEKVKLLEKAYADYQENLKTQPEFDAFENEDDYRNAYTEWREKRRPFEQAYDKALRETKVNLLEQLEKLPSKRLRAKDRGTAIQTKPAGVSQDAQDILDEAVAWIEAVSDGSLPSMSVGCFKTNDVRCFHKAGDVYMNPQRKDRGVFVHELGHAIDYHTDIGNKTKAFESQAVQKENVKWIGGGCKVDEVGSQDGFMDAYTGKHYPRPKSSEVLSMGLQHLYEDWVKFATEAPDHFNYTVAAIRGLL